MKYSILYNDFIDIKHPKSGNNVRLYRIISTVPITSHNHSPIPAETIGGYIQGENNLDLIDGSWVYNTAKVFGNAKICKDSIVCDNAGVYDDAVVENSIIMDYAMIYGKAVVRDSVVRGKSTIRGLANVIQSSINNSSLVEHRAYVEKSTLNDGSMVRNSARIVNCTLRDTVELCGDAVADNSMFSGGYFSDKGKIISQTLNRDVVLKFESGGSQ